MSAAVSDWFPAEVKPVHAGVYELRDLPFPFHYWDGKAWLAIAERSPVAITKSAIKTSGPMPELTYVDETKWRGLAVNPRARK